MRCKSCHAMCISTYEMYSEQICYYCYTSFSSLLVRHWKKVFQEVDKNATIETSDPIKTIVEHDRSLQYQNKYPVNPILEPKD